MVRSSGRILRWSLPCCRAVFTVFCRKAVPYAVQSSSKHNQLIRGNGILEYSNITVRFDDMINTKKKAPQTFHFFLSVAPFCSDDLHQTFVRFFPIPLKCLSSMPPLSCEAFYKPPWPDDPTLLLPAEVELWHHTLTTVQKKTDL